MGHIGAAVRVFLLYVRKTLGPGRLTLSRMSPTTGDPGAPHLGQPSPGCRLTPAYPVLTPHWARMANRFTGGVTIQVDTKGLHAMLALTNPKLLEKAEALGLKAAGRTARTQIPKGIAQRYTISSTRAKADVSAPTISAGVASLRLSRKPPTALQYRFRPGRRGGPQPGMGRGMGWGTPNPPGRAATIQVFKGRPAVPLPGAFLSPSGLPMLRVRRDRSKGSLSVLHGPSIGQIYTGRSLFARELRETTESAIFASFEKAFEKTINDAARGYGGR